MARKKTKRRASTGRKKARTPAQKRATAALVAMNKGKKKGGGRRKKSSSHSVNPWAFGRPTPAMPKSIKEHYHTKGFMAGLKAAEGGHDDVASHMQAANRRGHR